MKPFCLALFIFAANILSAQDNFFPGGGRNADSGRNADGEYYSVLRDGKILKVDFFEDKVVDTLLDLSGRRVQSHILSPDGEKALLISGRRPIYRHSFTAEWSIADLRTGETAPVSISAVPGMRDASFSPDGSRVAFVRRNDLYITEPGSNLETRITHDGKRNEIINGVTDWVYEEEYGFTRAYEFSPDSRQIAFLRFDESRVKEFSMMRYDGNLYPRPYVFKYPKAGEENSVVTLHVHDMDTGETRRIDTGAETDQYIPRIGWTPAGELFFYRVNRLQNVFEVLLADKEGSSRVIYEETSPRYVERPDEQTITFLQHSGRNSERGRFIVRNETRTGWMHLYLYSTEKGFLNAITQGEWEVTELLDIRDNKVWYLSTESSPLNRDLYSVNLNGKGKSLHTGGDGTYSITASPGMSAYVQTYSNAEGRSEKKRVKNIGAKQLTTKTEVLSGEYGGEMRKEFLSFINDEGIRLDGFMIKPAGFDPAKQYPVFMEQYSGPGSQSVKNAAWGGRNHMMYSRLHDAGYIIVCVDGRGTGFRGEEFKKCTYGELGKYETEDQIAVAKRLADFPFVDGSRIGIYGWSYGGFMALNCILKGSDVFKLAVAVAPVTSWRYYDTIYTEIYNGLPQDNPTGYDDNSPINFADRLEGKLLLIHGSGDDNVHVQNSYEMAKALVRAGKQFDMMIYPDDNHSMWPNGGANVREKIVDYVLTNL